jgi:hypothetical protein
MSKWLDHLVENWYEPFLFAGAIILASHAKTVHIPGAIALVWVW